MELTAVLIGIVMLAGIALYVGRPLLQSKRLTKSSGADASALEAQRESLYTQIKELDMDHATGKVNDDDYASQRAGFVAQAAEVLKQIDGLATPVSPEDEAEALIAARRKPRSAAAATTAAVVKPTAAAKSTDADVEAAIAARRKAAVPAANPSSANSPACPQCGKPIKADDAFCAKCGAALQPEAVR